MTRSTFVCWWLPPVAWGVFILVVTSIPRMPVPLPEVSGIDKVSHLAVYGVLGLLLMRAFINCQELSVGRATGWTLAAGGIFAVLQELNQTWIPGRGAEVLDLAANIAGLVLAAAAVVVWHRLTDGTHGRDRADSARGVSDNARMRKEMTTMAEALHVDEDTFESEVVQSDKPALVDFWAPWCGPCQMMGPTIDKLAGDYEGEAVIAKVNVDDSPDLASKYGIRSIPALLFFKDGEVADQMVGVQSEDTLKEKLDSMA
ncbi:MAG: thioredoxin [Armatimonadota bacterium]